MSLIFDGFWCLLVHKVYMAMGVFFEGVKQ